MARDPGRAENNGQATQLLYLLFRKRQRCPYSCDRHQEHTRLEQRRPPTLSAKCIADKAASPPWIGPIRLGENVPRLRSGISPEVNSSFRDRLNQKSLLYRVPV